MPKPINYKNYWISMSNQKDLSTGMYYREYKDYVTNIYPQANVTWRPRNEHPKYNYVWNPFRYFVLKGYVTSTDIITDLIIGDVRRYEYTAWKSAYLELKKLEEQNVNNT